MITRNELYISLSLAIAAASAPGTNEAPLTGNGKLDVDQNICLDFWPDGSLRIVGTNGRRLAVVFLKMPGLPNRGKFLIPIDKAAEMLLTFTPAPGDTARVSLVPFGQDQLMVTSGEDAMMIDGAQALYPEYHLMIENRPEDTTAFKMAVYDMITLKWVQDHLAPVADGAVAVNIRAYGPTVFRPRLRAFECITDVVMAIRPFKVD